MADETPLPEGTFQTIVVCTDGTPFSMRAVEVAFRLARRDRAKIIVISVVDTAVLADYAGLSERDWTKAERELRFNAEEALALVGKMAANAGVDAEMIIRQGRPHIEVVMAATQAEADLIVLGRRSGYRAGRRLLGNVALRVLEDADCSVLVVR